MDCKPPTNPLNKHQWAGRLTKLKMNVMRMNIGKLLRICVPEAKKWTEFGWNGTTVEEILEDLCMVTVQTKSLKSTSNANRPLTIQNQ